MIIPKPIHLFDNCIPRLEDDEEEIFYHHPKLDLKVNQIGMVYAGDSLKTLAYTAAKDLYEVKSAKGERITIRSANLILQCYSGKIENSNVRIYFLDGNPYNLTPNNILYPESLRKYAIQNTKEMIQKTIDYMVEKEKQLFERGIKSQNYWGIMGLYPQLKTEYQRQTGINLGYRGFNSPLDLSGNIKKPSQGERNVPKNYLTKEQLNQRTIYCREQMKNGKTKAELAREFSVKTQLIEFYVNRRLFIKE